MLTAEVISIGDELTTGQRLDTNSQWLAERLGDLGFRVMYHTTVADDLESNVRVFAAARDRVDVVVSTGGLGPTADDLTRDALARVGGVDLVLHEPSLEHIQRIFAHRGRPMPPTNRVQAMFPAGSRPIYNPHGTAPGIAWTAPRPGGGESRLYALPGVPAEMKEMWSWIVDDLRQAGYVRGVVQHHRIKCFGVGESDLESMLPDLIRRGRSPSVGITVSGATITLRITSSADNADAARAAMEPTIATIRQCLGTLIFGCEDDELEHAVSRLLLERGQRLAVLDCGVDGLLAHWFQGDPACKPALAAGLVIGDATTAGGLLRAELLDALDPQSPDLPAALAAAGRERGLADLVLAVGPAPAVVAAGQAPSPMHFALADAEGVITRSTPYWGHPAILKLRAAKQALDFVRLRLLHGGARPS